MTKKRNLRGSCSAGNLKAKKSTPSKGKAFSFKSDGKAKLVKKSDDKPKKKADKKGKHSNPRFL